MFSALPLSFSILNYLLPPTAWSLIPNAQFPSKHYIIHIYVMHTNTKHIFSGHIFFSLWTYPLMYPKRPISFVKMRVTRIIYFCSKVDFDFWESLGWLLRSSQSCLLSSCSLLSFSLSSIYPFIIHLFGIWGTSQYQLCMWIVVYVYILCIHSIW